MPDTIPILFDTDIGSDIDDAVALGYLLRQPDCELVGVTTVSGEVRQRAALADAVCRAAGRTDVPIHAGIEQPLVGPQKQPNCPQVEILDRFDHTAPEKYRIGDAIAFMHKHKVRNAPVIDKNGAIAGFMTIGRIIRFLANAFPSVVLNLPPEPMKVPEEREGG